MEAAYFQAAIPEPFRILGVALKPLSLGRYRLLKRFGCGFVADSEQDASAGDLLLGLVICSSSVEEFLELATSHRLRKEVRRWARKVSPWPALGFLPWVGKWWRKSRSFDVIEKMLLFKRYIAEGSATPKYWDETEGGHQSGAHWSQSVEVVLRGELGWTSEEINEAPLTKALDDYFKWAENQGHVRLMTSDEIRETEEMETEEEKRKAESRKQKSEGTVAHGT